MSSTGERPRAGRVAAPHDLVRVRSRRPHPPASTPSRNRGRYAPISGIVHVFTVFTVFIVAAEPAVGRVGAAAGSVDRTSRPARPRGGAAAVLPADDVRAGRRGDGDD